MNNLFKNNNHMIKKIFFNRKKALKNYQDSFQLKEIALLLRIS